MSKTIYKSESERQGHPPDDPVLAMLGVGKQLWVREQGDRFVERLRAEDTEPSRRPRLDAPAHHLADLVWQRISKYQKEVFRTARRLPFTYEVEGTGIWFFRNGRRINRKLTRTQIDVAISRCPLSSTTEISDLIDYSYLFALLVDRRIRGDAW